MKAFLRWFPQYRELERQLREEAGRGIDMQDRLGTLLDQNVRLGREVGEARAEKDQSIKTVANVGFQMAGHLPPYPEAYQLPNRPPPAEAGPVSTGRMFARDAVKQGKDEFRASLFGVDIKPEPLEAEAS